MRAVHLDSANKDSTGLDLSINNKAIPEVDISYFFAPNWAAELVLTYPQKHDLKAGGSKIVMDSSGITISAAKITIKASGTVGIKGSGGVAVKGAKIGEN